MNTIFKFPYNTLQDFDFDYYTSWVWSPPSGKNSTGMPLIFIKFMKLDAHGKAMFEFEIYKAEMSEIWNVSAKNTVFVKSKTIP